MNKKYIIEVATNKASLEKLKSDLSNAIQTPLDEAAQEGRIKGLTRSEKAVIKNDLATLFGVADYQADALRKMVQGIIPSDTKGITDMKNQLKETLDFATGIMQKMQQIGDSTDWMKQGVSFVDDFTKMQTGLADTQEVVKGLEGSVRKLTKTFEVFKDALAETNADAFLQRFGNSTRSEAESLARAQKELEKIAKNRTKALQDIIKQPSDEDYDYSHYSADEIKREYKIAIQTIEDANKEIDILRNKFKGRTNELYKSKAYQDQIAELSDAMNQIKNLPSISDDGIDANLKISLKEATDSVQAASNEIKNILDGLQKEGIELSITLPDADSEKFVSQINDFVAKATKQFKTKPIEVAATIKNPFKETKTEEGLDSNNIADNFTKSIDKVKEAINSGYKDLRAAVNSESSLLNKELFLKFGYKKSDTDALITDALESMQNTIYEGNPLEIKFDTESVAEKLAEDIQNALKSIKMPSMPTTNIGNAQTSTIPVRVVGGLPLKIETQDGSKQPESLSVPKKVPTQPVQNKVDEKTKTIQTDNTNAIKTSSEVQRALNKALTSLNATVQTQNNIIDRNQRTIKDYEDSVSGEEETREINNLKSDIAKLREKLIEPEKKEQTIRDEQSKLFAKYNQAKSAYDTRYEELASNEAYKDIKKFDERLRILRANRDETDREYRAQISEFDKKISDAQKKLGKSKKDDAYWNRAIEDYTKQRAEIETKRQGKLKKLDDGISGVEAERKNALSTNAAAQQIAKELEPLALAIVDARKQLNTKSQELHNITSETDKIKTELGKKEEELESKIHSKEIDAAQKKIDAAQKKTEPLSKRRDMIQSILDNNQDPVKLVLDATNQFWESSAKTINSAQNSMLRYASDDAMKAKLKGVFEKQTKLESLDPKSDDYKKLKADIDKIWNEIDEAAKSLTDKNARNFNVSKSKYNNSYIRRNSMALQGLTDMSDLDEEEALNIVTSLLKKNKVTSSRISKIPSTPLLKDLSEYVKISKTALGVQDQTDEQYDADIKAQNALLQTARNIELLKRLYKAFPKSNELPDKSVIENFIKAFSGFEEMRDVVESATQYLNALDEVKKITDSNPAFKSLSAPEIMQRLYGNLSDDAKSKLSVALDGYGLKDVNISELEGDALVDAINKMTTAFQNKAFDNLDINENAIKGIINVLQRNESLMSAKEQLEFAVESRRRYLDGSKYTTQGRVPGTARTKTDNVYDVLKSNEPLSVEVVNGDKSWVASIYNPKGAPGQADKSYKANSYGFGNFLYESGIRKEMDAIVEASIRETYLDNISKRLESWHDGYKPSKNEITQMFDSLGGDLSPEDYKDADGAVIEVDELRRYVQQQKEDMVTAKQLLDELISSGKIRVAIGKNSIVPDYAKDSGAYREIEADEKKQADKEAELESTISKLKSLTVEDQAKKIQSSYNYLNDDEKSRFSTILSGYGLKDIDISKLDGKELINVFNKIKTALANESELESLISGIKSQNPKDQATEMQTKYNSLSKDSKAKINAILSKYNLKGKDISKLKGEKLTDAFDVMKKALGEDSLTSLYGIKRKDGERPFSSILSNFNIEQDIAKLEAQLVQLREIRIAQEQEVDKIIVIDKDIATHTAKADHAQKGVNAAKSVSKNLSRWGNKSNYYKNATKKEKHKYEYGHISIDELLENINFAKIYGIGDTSALEEVVSTYNKAIAEKRSIEESGTTGETLDAAIAAVDAAEQNLINKYFGTDGWYVTKWLREQFASVNVKNESDMQSVQRELDADTKKQDEILSELEKVHVERIQQINNETSQMLSTYLDSSKMDVNAEKHQREKVISDKKKDIDKQILALNSEADKNPKIAALKAKAIQSFETDEYKALNSTYQKYNVSNNPADKELAKTYKAQLDAYEADYRSAKEKWIKNRTNQLNKEFEDFVQSIEQSAHPKANEHSDKIASKKAEIEKRKKALTTKEANKDKEVKRLKANRDAIKKKIDAADAVGDIKSSRKLKQEYFNADERYRIAKDGWIAKKSTDLDKELIAFIEELEAEGRSVEKFNSGLSEGEKPVTSAAEIRARIQERNTKLLQEENDRFRQELEESVKSTNGGSESLDKRKDEIEAEAQKLKQDAIDRVTKHGKVMTDSEFMASQYDAISKSRAEEVANEKEEARLLKEKRDAIQTQHAIQDDIIAERKSTLEAKAVEDAAYAGTFADGTNISRSAGEQVQFLSVLDVSNLTADSMSVNSDQNGVIGLLGQIAKDGTLKSAVETLQSILSTLSNGIKVTSDKNGDKKKGGKKAKEENSVNIAAGDAWNVAQEYIQKKYPGFTSLSALKPVSGGYSIDIFRPNDLEAYKKAQQKVNDLIDAGKQETVDFAQAQAELNKLKYEQEKITLKIGSLNNEIQVTQEKSSLQNLAIGIKAASKELQTAEGMLAQIHEAGILTIGDDGKKNSSNKVVQNYLNSLKLLEDYKNDLSTDQLFDPIVNQQVSKYTLDVQNYRKEVMSLLKATSQLNVGKLIETDKLADGIEGLSNDEIKRLMLDIVSSGNQLETKFKELIPVTDDFGDTVGYQLAYTVRNSKHEVQEMTATLNPLTNELRVQKGAVKEVATGWQQFFNGLKGKVASIMQYLVSITSIQDIFRYMREGVQYVREIDSALTELKKVTDETDASYAKFLQNMSKTGGVIGATVADLTTSAADWARLNI